MSKLKEIKEVYGKELPGKTAFRNDEDAPCSLQDLYEDFGSWDNFVAEYEKFLKPAKVTTPVAKPKAPAEATINDKAK
jgi:hypothetical protein